MSTVFHPAPKSAGHDGVADMLKAALGSAVLEAVEAHGELSLTVSRDALPAVMTALRDDHAYQQLMEIAGVDYPSRPERFEVCYHLLSVTKNHRLRVKVAAAENTPVPTVTTIWPAAGWLEREVFDMYGVLFAGHADLRRILTDYGFQGHPFRKDFPLTGYVELRYSEADKRVVYEPVKLAQDLRTFDFMSPWEGADYVLPGDEKAAEAAPPASPPPAAPAPGAPAVSTPKTTDSPAQTGAGKATNKAAASRKSAGAPAVKTVKAKAPGSPDPTSSRPARKPRAKKGDKA